MSYNVNGIRSAQNKGFIDFLKSEKPDIVCLQELKAQHEQIDIEAYKAIGYGHCYWHSAMKKGYSGVAILSKIEPKCVEIGSENALFDSEGRILRADFDDFSVMSCYFPSGSSGDERQGIKIEFLRFFRHYIDVLKQNLPNLIICGDYNIAHTEIDIHNPKANKDTPGFLPQERQWLTDFLESGFVDTFRHLNPQATDQYSWWSFRANARQNNKGWRIDYINLAQNLLPKLKHAAILTHITHADHCPITIEL